MPIHIRPYHSPCGDLLLGSYNGKLCLCDWATERRRAVTGKRLQRIWRADYVEAPSEVLRMAAEQLDAYFAGERIGFAVPLLFAGTDFQKSVWQALLEIPYGHTISYAELAARLGKPSAVRAVANANGANALSIFVPCHRVIGANHSLTGYAGGLAAKRWLLNLEQAKL